MLSGHPRRHKHWRPAPLRSATFWGPQFFAQAAAATEEADSSRRQAEAWAQLRQHIRQRQALHQIGLVRAGRVLERAKTLHRVKALAPEGPNGHEWQTIDPTVSAGVVASLFAHMGSAPSAETRGNHAVYD